MGNFLSYLKACGFYLALKRKWMGSGAESTTATDDDEACPLSNQKKSNVACKTPVPHHDTHTIDELCSSRIGPPMKEVTAVDKAEIKVNCSTRSLSSPSKKSRKFTRNPENESGSNLSVSQSAGGIAIKLFSVNDPMLKTVQVSSDESGSKGLKSTKLIDTRVHPEENTKGSITSDSSFETRNERCLSDHEVIEDENETGANSTKDSVIEHGGSSGTPQPENTGDPIIADLPGDSVETEPKLPNDFDPEAVADKNQSEGKAVDIVDSVIEIELGEPCSQMVRRLEGEDKSEKSDVILSNEEDNAKSEDFSKIKGKKEEAQIPVKDFGSNSKQSKKRSKKKEKFKNSQTSDSFKKPRSYNWQHPSEIDEHEIPDASPYFQHFVPVGRKKGLEWNSNSCYMDAMLFSMFYTTKIFDSFFETLQFSKSPTDLGVHNVQRILWDNIVTPLREKGFVEAHTGTSKLRQALRSINSRMLGSMMDVDELVSILFKKALNLQDFIEYSIGTRNHMHQIFFNPNDCPATPNGFIDVQNLLIASMKFQNLKLSSVPVPGLIIKMSRSNGSLVFHEGILPNLVLDISPLMVDEDKNGPPLNMYLVAVVVLRSCHYTAYVRHGIKTSSPWYYFDSLPASVVKCSELGEKISRMEQNLKDMGNNYGDVGSVVTDNHVCIYFSPDALNSRY